MTSMADIEAGRPAEATPQGAELGWNPLQLAQQGFSTSSTYFDASIRKQVESAIRQFQGVHPAGSKYHSDVYKTRSRLFRPKTRTAIRRNEASAAEAFFSTRDAVAIEAEDDSNPLQKAAAEFMKHALEYRLKHSIPWFQVCMGAYQDAQTVGVVVSYQYWRYDAKKKIDKPAVELIPLENFRFDPGANWMDPVGTSPYLIRMIPMYVKDVKARARGVTGRPRWKPMTDAQILAASQSYTDSTRQTRERGRTDPKDGAGAITDFSTVWVHENIVEIDGQDYCYYTLATIALLTDPVPLEDVYWHGERPFTIGCVALETHKNFPDGIPGITKDLQAEANHVANARLDSWAYALNRRYFAKRSGQVDIRSLTRNVPGSVTLMNDTDKDVKVMDTQDVARDAFKEQELINLDMDDAAGTFSASSVQSNRALNETVGGLNLISTTASQVGQYQLRTFVETWAQPALRQVMRLIAFYEDDQRILALSKGATEAAGYTIEAVTDELMQQDLMLSVDVGIGATNPQERVNNFMKAMNSLKMLLADGVLERYGADVGDIIAEIFGHLGYRDGKRFFDKEDDPTLAGMRAQLQQLQAALAAKISPELVAAQVRKLDADASLTDAKRDAELAKAIEIGVRSAFSSLQGAELIAAIPGLAPIADKLIQGAAGGWQPNVDPNLPQPAAPSPQVGLEDVKNKQVGTVFTPGMAAAGDTTPNTPANPASPETGVAQGIETMRADS